MSTADQVQVQTADQVNETKTTQQKVPRVRKILKKSNVLLTFNPQVRFETGSEPNFKQYAKKLKQSIDNMFISENMPKYIKFLTPDHVYDPKFIKSIEIDAGVEHGPENRTLHAHVGLRVQHWSKIHFNGDAMRADFKREMGIEGNIHFDMQIWRSTEESMLKYVYKNPVDA
jgi:hypothetical protein